MKPDSPESDDAFRVLQGYLDDLHHGRRPERARLLAEHPELAEALSCLDALDAIAAPPSDTDWQATVMFDGSPAPPKSAALPPTVFGKYELEVELGRGGMGVVYRARQVDLGRLVALKMILAGNLASGDQLARFKDEAKAAALVSHPHVVTVYEAGEIDGQPFFAMQYVCGHSLTQRLRDGPLPPEEAARIVLAVAHAVHHLHDHGIIHRDLKPSNILIDESGHPFVTDFGLVKLLAGASRHTRSGAIVGTPSYMSPEQAAGRSQEVGPISDVWSLGAILYETMTGEPPFREESPLDTLVQVLEGEATPPRQLRPQVPKELEQICLRCLEKSPEERFTSAEHLAQALECFLKGEETGVAAPGLGYRLRRWARREPALLSRLAMLMLCVVITQVNYSLLGKVTLELHVKVLAIVAAWAAASMVCQQLMNYRGLAEPARFVWAGVDVALFSLLVWVADDVNTPVTVGFPLIVAASGLWFRVPLVWFTAAACIGAYGLLLALESEVRAPHKHAIFLVGLGVLAFMTAYQVQRVRALSKYYERRPLP